MFNVLRRYGIVTSVFIIIVVVLDIFERITNKNKARIDKADISNFIKIPPMLLMLLSILSLISSIFFNYTFADATDWHNLSMEPDGVHIYYVDYMRCDRNGNYMDSGVTAAKISKYENKYYINAIYIDNHKTIEFIDEEITTKKSTYITDTNWGGWDIMLIDKHAQCNLCLSNEFVDSCPIITEDKRSTALSSTVVFLRIISTIYFIVILCRSPKPEDR